MSFLHFFKHMSMLSYSSISTTTTFLMSIGFKIGHLTESALHAVTEDLHTWRCLTQWTTRSFAAPAKNWESQALHSPSSQGTEAKTHLPELKMLRFEWKICAYLRALWICFINGAELPKTTQLKVWVCWVSCADPRKHTLDGCHLQRHIHSTSNDGSEASSVFCCELIHRLFFFLTCCEMITSLRVSLTYCGFSIKLCETSYCKACHYHCLHFRQYERFVFILPTT